MRLQLHLNRAAASAMSAFAIAAAPAFAASPADSSPSRDGIHDGYSCEASAEEIATADSNERDVSTYIGEHTTLLHGFSAGDLSRAATIASSIGGVSAMDNASDGEVRGVAGPQGLPSSQDPEARYLEGLNLLRHHDMRGALDAFRDAADSGYGMAGRKLGDIYGTGNDDIERDYETSLRWYRKARDQGIEIPNKPFVYTGIRRY